MTTNELDYESLEEDSPIDLEKELINLREKRLPLQQEADLAYQKVKFLNHQIEQIKSKLNIANKKYYSKKT